MSVIVVDDFILLFYFFPRRGPFSSPSYLKVTFKYLLNVTEVKSKILEDTEWNTGKWQHLKRKHFSLEWKFKN